MSTYLLTAKMLKFITFVVFGTVIVASQNWRETSYVLNPQQYFKNVMDETIFELERREWCNIKLDDIKHSIELSLYNFEVDGDVVYANGFLISIQRIEIKDIQGLLSNRVAGGVNTTLAIVRGKLSLHDAKVGFDVKATLNNNGETSVHRFTGTFNFLLIDYEIQMTKVLETGMLSAFAGHLSSSAALGTKMIYMPANNISEALSRTWQHHRVNIERWGPDVIQPIILDAMTNKISFPDICIGCNA